MHKDQSWQRHQSGDDKLVLPSEFDKRGNINLYRPKTKDGLRHTLLSAFAQIMGDRIDVSKLSDSDNHEQLEGIDFESTRLLSANELFSAFAEALISEPSGVGCLIAKLNPIRAKVFGAEFSSILNSLPIELRSHKHNEFVSLVTFIEKQITANSK
ncbi:MAG: hypothetical protein K2X81_18680 [Candidatus Obscuribacterales bacterium]|nr:hypothetical protein [Candidatus Obscuribacterales bacterium]